MKKNKNFKPTLLKDYKPSNFLIDDTHLQFTLEPTATEVKAKLHIKINSKAKKSKNNPLKLNGLNLNLKEVKLNGKKLTPDKYTVTADNLTIFKVPNKFILETTVITHPCKNFACCGLYISDNNFCTQNEPQGFRNLTYFIDRPDILTRFTTTIIADKRRYPVLLSNGNLVSKSKLKNNLQKVVWEDPFPKSAYLFALVAGKYSHIEDYHVTKSGRKITLRIFTEPKQLKQCHHAMGFLKQAMEWEEKNFGLEYDLDLYQIVAVNDFNFGAMENKGLNIFNSNLLLASPLTATDADFRRIAAVIGHEYFHNWTGNRITCRNWFQIGLKEGLTTLREQLFMEDSYGTAINRIDSIRVIQSKQFAEDSGPLSHPVRLKSYLEVENFYTITVYYKSAEIARMLIEIFGRKVFQKIMKDFLSKFDGQAVTIEDFLQSAAKTTKTDLNQFKRWHDQAGTPKLAVTDSFSKKNKTYTLKIKQQLKKGNKPFYIPLELGLVDKIGTDAAKKIAIINRSSQSIKFKNIKDKPIPSLLRNFSAPIKLEYKYSDDDLLFLAIHDQDATNRWEASQKLMTNIIGRLAKSTKKVDSIPLALLKLFQTVITDKNTDLALATQMLTFPSESFLFEHLTNTSIEAIHATCDYLKTNLALSLKEEFLHCYKENSTKKRYDLKPESIAKRGMKNLALSYLMQLNNSEAFALCYDQLEKADNLTDIMASLNCIANSTCSAKEKVLENYYKKWQDQPNLVNKWLAINSNIKTTGNLQRIKKLVRHPGFNIRNPNKVFALIRTFCENNLVNFHAKNGAGYKFLADQILAVDKFNPALAALITIPLTRGRKLDKARQKLIQKQIDRLNKHPNLSKNVYEITSAVRY